MRKDVRLFFIALLFAVANVCNQPSLSSEPPEDMVLIPAGDFFMGADSQLANADQKPLHNVYLDAFYIDKHEVTNAQYEEFILAGGYTKKKYWTAAGWDFVQKHQIVTPLQYGENSVSMVPDHPVIGVSWYEANAYATWMGKRLPTEAEWEKAARGTKANLYPWGNETDFSKLSYFPHVTKLQAAGSFPEGASPYGAMDMAGSVWEWCADWYSQDYYLKSPRKIPKGPNSGEHRVLRGGGWDSIRLQLRTDYRYFDKEDRRSYDIGFRCAQDTPNR